MRKPYLLIMAVFLIFALTIIAVGCLQNPKSNQPQSGQPGNGIQTGTQGATVTENAGQNYNPSTPGQPQKTYIVSVSVFRIGSGISISYQGGEDAASLQYIAIFINGVYQGDIRDINGQTPLPVGSKGTFPANNPGNDHITGIGHFTNGDTQVIMDNTL
jgi:hypothetical protein